MSVSIDEILKTLKTRYGQLVTDPKDFFTHRDYLEMACKTAIFEYSYFRPLSKIMNIQGSPNGTFLGNDVINVRNIRITNFYFNKLSPRLPRRYKQFNKDTHMLYTPYSAPLTVEVGCLYPIRRSRIQDRVYTTLLTGDRELSFELESYSRGTLKVAIKDYYWTDVDVNYEWSSPDLKGSENVVGKASLDVDNNRLILSELNITEDTPLLLSYNPIYSTIEGITLRDKLCIDLCIGHCLVSLGNIKAQMQTDGDVISFSADNLIEQGQALITQTLESLDGSSTSYASL